jgi:hypothetical protein
MNTKITKATTVLYQSGDHDYQKTTTLEHGDRLEPGWRDIVSK